MYGYVYLIKNMVNGRPYVGSHAGSYFDKNYYGSGNNIKKAIKKYGRQFFRRKILFRAKNYDDLMSAETYFIKKIINKYGDRAYNIALDGRRCMLGRKHKPETIKFYSESRRGENNPMYGVRMIGKDNPNYGRKHSEEFKRRISEMKRGKGGVSHHNYGLVRSDDFKKKVSASKKGQGVKDDFITKIFLENNIYYSDMPKWAQMIVASYRSGSWQKEKTVHSNIDRLCSFLGIGRYSKEIISRYSKNKNYYKEDVRYVKCR